MIWGHGALFELQSMDELYNKSNNAAGYFNIWNTCPLVIKVDQKVTNNSKRLHIIGLWNIELKFKQKRFDKLF